MRMKNIDKQYALSLQQKEQLTSEIEYLGELMLPQRLEVLKRVLGDRTDYITVCVENIFHSQNASAIVRSCEAFGIQNIHAIEVLCGFKPNVNIVRGSDKWVDINRYSGPDATLDLVKKLKADGYRIVSTSPHKNGVSCEQFDISKGKTAIFFGTEKQGISPQLEELSDEFITIPMYGFVESLNISVCAAIALQSLTHKLRQSNIDWKLTEDQQLSILNRWVKYSVKDSQNILDKIYYKNKNNE